MKNSEDKCLKSITKHANKVLVLEKERKYNKDTKFTTDTPHTLPRVCAGYSIVCDAQIFFAEYRHGKKGWFGKPNGTK